jgi:hypothetical protein
VQPLTKRQREILDYLQEFIQQYGYAPSLEEIGRRFGLSSLATVHKHLTNLEEKGFIRRLWNRSRSVELLSARTGQRAVELPMLGYVAAGLPIEAVAGSETIAVPEDLVGRRETYVLRVKGDSMIDEQIRDRLGRRVGRHAEEVLPGAGAHPAAAGQPGDAAHPARPGPGAVAGRRRRSHEKVLTWLQLQVPANS